MISALRGVISPRRNASRSSGRSRSLRTSLTFFSAVLPLIPSSSRPLSGTLDSPRALVRREAVEAHARLARREVAAVHLPTVAGPSDIARTALLLAHAGDGSRPLRHPGRYPRPRDAFFEDLERHPPGGSRPAGVPVC